MAALNFTYSWYDDDKTAMHYRAMGEWTWRDYHAVVQISTFAMMNHAHPVHSIIDLRESTRARMPSGVYAHARSFGKQVTPALSGHAIVIGLPADAHAQLHLEADGTLAAVNGSVYFVADEDGLRAQLAVLNAAS